MDDRSSPTAAPLERAHELDVLERALAATSAGAGELVVLEAPAGLGKSLLLAQAAARARATGLAVLEARASELERAFPFGVALQLFGPPLAALDPAGREAVLTGAARLAAPLFEEGAAEQAGDLHVAHGLYWLAANLAERAPLALLVDDAHWCDEPTLRLFGYLAQRIDELPLALVVAARPGGAPVPGDLATHPQARRLRPAPLSEQAVATLVREATGAEADPRFAAACADVSDGNPYLLGVLLAAAAAEGLRPDAAGARRVPQLAPGGVLEALAARVARLPPDAAALARAVAILGDGAQPGHAAALAGLEDGGATEAAAALAGADVLRPGEPLAFAHPLARAAVVARMPEAERAAAHLRAAELLRAEGAPPERLAAHLLPAPAGGRAWIVDALRAAAAHSLALGAPDAAAGALRRALAEDAADGDRAALLLELGRAEATAGTATAAGRFAEAARLLSDPGERADALRALARSRIAAGDHRGARAAYQAALAELGSADNALAAHLRAEQLVVAALDPAHPPDEDAVQAIVRHDRVGATPAGRALLATLAVHELYAGSPRARVLALADRALADGALLEDEGARETTVYGVVLALFVCEELSRAEALSSDLIAAARGRGSVIGVASASYSRAWARLIAGRVAEAVDDAQQAVAAGAHGWRMFLPGAYGALTHALLDQGDVEEAERQLREAEAVDAQQPAGSIQVLDARGRMHLTRGRAAAAAADFLAAGELAGPQRNPLVYATWRSNAALALARNGERGRARELAEEELALAREFGAPRGIGVALRTLGVVEGGERGVELLAESVAALQGSEALLERGRSLVAYGSALRRSGRREDATAALREALELARPGGAGAIERGALEELAAAGPAAERVARPGRAALSPPERRVAQLAAEGWSDRAIAEELFVTRRAVRDHLRSACAKLGISSRRGLPAALGVPAPRP